MGIKTDLSPIRKWNLFMVVCIASVLLAQRFVGHIVSADLWLERALIPLAIGLTAGVLLQARQNRKQK